jgi:DNA mismatch endonuclease (patch repair protein)
MRANRRRDTGPERRLRAALHGSGLRYRVDPPIRVDGWARAIRPDVAFTGAKVAVFVDGCYWHACPVHYEPSKSNVSYWRAKIARNRKRDSGQVRALSEDGWLVLRFWEHEPVEVCVEHVRRALRDRSATSHTRR